MSAAGGRRILVVGLDGATFRTLSPWAAAGEMPELARLMAAGAHGELRSTFPPLTPPAWASFMTGKNPGKHGVFSFRRLAATAYRSGELITANQLRARTLWDIVGDAGRRVGAINVPPSYPVRPVKGFMVACLMAPPGAATLIHPPELRSLLPDDYTISIEPPSQLLPADPAYREQCLDYLGRLRRLAEQRLAVTLRLLREQPWDLLSVVFYEPDRIQHFFWSHLAAAGPAGVAPDVIAAIADEARAIFRQLDRALGELVRAAGPETVTLVVSDHGFGPAPERFVYVNRWLADRGLLHARASWRWRRRLVRNLPAKLRARYDTVENVFVDWSRSHAWCEVMETRSAGIWLNVRGRQPEGRVAPGAEYEAVREEIRRGLAGLQENGRPVFALVARREDVYRGPMTELAPDLLLYTAPSHGLMFSGLRPELRARTAFAPFVEYGFTGAHEPAGIFVAAGPGIAPRGRQPDVPIEALAPTILCLLGIPVPDGMDAPPLLDLLTPEARAAAPLRYVPDSDPAPVDDEGWRSADDQAEVEARLRALGYVE
jgi:predicted AlkP superfamily phosphohydrolase/phosphomutase